MMTLHHLNLNGTSFQVDVHRAFPFLYSMEQLTMKIFLTGGTGFIGSHTAVVLLEAGHDVILYDNLSNSDACVVNRIEEITGKRPLFIEGDIRNETALEKALSE